MAMSSIYQYPYMDSMGYVKFHGGSQIGSSTQRDEEKHSKICETIIFQSQIRLFHAQICWVVIFQGLSKFKMDLQWRTVSENGDGV